MKAREPEAGHGACGAKTRTGGTCRKPAGWGTDHVGVGRCKLHGGSTPNHKRSAVAELARRECSSLGLVIETNAADALLQEIWETAANVAFYRELVQALPTHPKPAKRREIVGGPDDGDVEWDPPVAGIYNPTFHVSGLPTGKAEPHILVVLYNEERDRLVKCTTAALKIGLAEQQVKLAEKQAALIAQGYHAFAVAMGLDPSTPKVREAMRASLTVIQGGRVA